MKSPSMMSWTCFNLKISPVPVVCVKSSGARISGFGDGSEVKCGFWDRAASRASADSWGVIRVISVEHYCQRSMKSLAPTYNYILVIPMR